MRVRRYDVTIEREQLGADPVPQADLAHGPYVAEIYPIAVEWRHIVVDVSV